ncbi:MAG TPA: DUF2070 family protein [Geobacterales bacterium]|nr:DUF2070 family protein [Geobacterales bacterium]
MKKTLDKFYKELWSLPNSKILLIYSALVSALLILLVYIFSTAKMAYLAILFGLPLIQILFSKMDRFTTTKRVYGYFLFYSIGLIISLLIYYLTTLIFLSLAVIISFIILGSIAFEFTSPINKIIKTFYAFIVSFPLLLFHSSIISKNSYNILDLLLRSYFIFGVALFFSELYLFLIRKVISSKYKVDLFEHLKAFLLSWISKNHDYFQDIIKKTATEKRKFQLEIMSIKFKSGKILGLLSLPIHPGPFSKVGSSDLPTLLMTKNPHFFAPFHGFTTHEMDLVNKEDGERVVDMLEKEVFKADAQTEIKATKMVERQTKNFDIKGFVLGNTPVLIVSANKADIIDDIGISLHEKAKEIARTIGFESIIAIDAHNSYIEGLKKVERYDEEILEGISLVLKELKNESKETVKVGFKKIRLNDIPKLKDEISSGEGYVISFVGKEFKNVLILIDSNNINFDLRNKLLERLEKLGIKSEICSTDTHVMTGSIMGHNGYLPFGYNTELHDEIIERILEATEGALKIQEDAMLAISRIETPDLKILGGLMKAYENGTNKFVKYGKILPYVVFTFSVLISFLAYPLL